MNLVAKLKKIDKIEDDPDDKTFPAHWTNTKNEVHGTDTMYVEADFGAFLIGVGGSGLFFVLTGDLGSSKQSK